MIIFSCGSTTTTTTTTFCILIKQLRYDYFYYARCADDFCRLSGTMQKFKRFAFPIGRSTIAIPSNGWIPSKKGAAVPVTSSRNEREKPMQPIERKKDWYRYGRN